MTFAQAPLDHSETAYQMTQDQANNYGLRMFNDDAWEKEYTPHVNRFQYMRHADDSVSVTLPVTLTVERICVCEDNLEEYVDRPNAVDSELAQDDQGVISVPLELACHIPADFKYKADMDTETLIEKLSFKVDEVGVPVMYDGKLELSQNARDHLVERINKSYMVLDTLNQNIGLVKRIFN